MKPSDQEITDYMQKYKQCPDCGCDQFYDGPGGGISQNIICVSCGAKFNMTMGQAERIGEPNIPEGCVLARFEIPVFGFFQRMLNWI